jgi:hypothetical protein
MNAKDMQVISTRTHGVLDYLTVGFALAFPRVLGCSQKFTNAVTAIALGKLAYAMMTRHELGLVKMIPMKTHLALDAVGGATLAALPFLMDEDEDPAAVGCAVGMGLFDIAAAPITQTTPVADDAGGMSRSSGGASRGGRRSSTTHHAQESMPSVAGL